jgi:hypothetical protein
VIVSITLPYPKPIQTTRRCPTGRLRLPEQDTEIFFFEFANGLLPQPVAGGDNIRIEIRLAPILAVELFESL